MNNDNYVAWLRYGKRANGETFIAVCDSDAQGAFKVYRGVADSAWLIEWPHEDGRPMYWGRVVTGVGKTPEHMDAIRFSREQDALSVIEHFVLAGSKAVEHMWDRP